MSKESQNHDTWTVPFSEGQSLRRGPVFVALDDDNTVVAVEVVNTLTTLGALHTTCRTKEKYKSATTIAPGLVNVSEIGYGEGELLRIFAQNSEAESLWWNELLLWDQHGNWLG